MSQSSFSQTYNASTSVNIPSNAANVTVTVCGGRGGRGGNDAGASGGGRGNGIIGSFILSNFTARTLTLAVGAAASNAPSDCATCRGLGGSSNVAAGGNGGYSGPNGSSGGGGGGGGATGIYDSVAGKWIIVAGGGGGGGGASYPGVTAYAGNDASTFSTGLTNSLISGGGAGGSVGNDGGGGGGGGGGAGGGGGGNAGADVSVGNIRAGGGAGGTSKYDSSYATITGVQTYNSSDTSPDGYVTISYTLYTPQINSFYASPNPQTSGSSGVPSSSTTLYWTSTDSTSASINQGVGSVNTSGSAAVNTALQSVAGSNSPASKNYTLTVCAGTVCTTSSVNVNVYNDNYPNSFTIPSVTTTGTVLNNLDPNTQYNLYIGSITGIDMTTAIVCNTAGLDASLDQVSWSSTIYITSGQGFYLRFYSQPFNTDPSGLTNSKTFYFTVGSFPTQQFTATTRAPIVNEVFDFGNDIIEYPYPDIDQIVNSPSQYIISPTTINVDNVEIPVEIKVNNSNAEIRIKPSGSGTYGSWQTPRST